MPAIPRPPRTFAPGEIPPGTRPAAPAPAAAPGATPAAAPPAGPMTTPTGQPGMPADLAPSKLSDKDYIAEVRNSGKNKSEDYARFSDEEILAWRPWYAGNGRFKNNYGDIVDKPDERGANTPHNRNGTGDQGDFGWGWNDSGVGGHAPEAGGAGGPGGGGGGGGMAPGGPWGGGGGWGGAPTFNFDPSKVMQDPGFQWRLGQGVNALERSAAARGNLFTGGTSADIMKYGQDMASQEYGNAWNRAFGTQQAQYQSQYAPWALGQNIDLSRWTTRFGGDLSKYLQRQDQVYGLLNPQAPSF